MSVSNVGVATQSTEQAAQSRLTTDTDSFLRLMVAQLSNQDPLQPVDSTQWVAQLAQFSSVEQQVQSNGKLAEVLTELRSSAERMDLSYIGRKVEVEGDQVGLQDGKLAARYSVPDKAESVTVYVLDGEGTVARSFQGSTIAGTYDLAWDGKTADGVQMDDGTYTIFVDARDEAGKSLSGSTVTYDATVTRVRRQDGLTLFDLSNGVSIDRDSIISAA